MKHTHQLHEVETIVQGFRRQIAQLEPLVRVARVAPAGRPHELRQDVDAEIRTARRPGPVARPAAYIQHTFVGNVAQKAADLPAFAAVDEELIGIKDRRPIEQAVNVCQERADGPRVG